MGRMKDALLDLLEALYPDDFEAQELLQTRLMASQELTADEFKRAQETEIGRQMISNGLVHEGVCV